MNLGSCISASLFKDEILELDNIIFEVLILKQTCIIVIIKLSEWKGQKNKNFFTEERSWRFINNRFSYLGRLRPFNFCIGVGDWEEREGS